jgi:TRAP-type C4-dicarboxylate transport system substrate-binding protein
MSKPIVLRWLIAHQPAYLFVRTAKAFAKELDKLLPGQFEVEVLMMGQYIQKYGDIPELKIKPAETSLEKWSEEMPTKIKKQYTPSEWIDVRTKWAAFWKGLREQKFHMSQTQITVIGGHLDRRFRLLDLPFLFKDHDHVTKSLDGSIGQKLLDTLHLGEWASKTHKKDGRDTSGVRGLGFTYSGGYRIIGSDHPITSLDDLKGLDLVTTPATDQLFCDIGAKAKPRINQKIQEIKESASNGGAVETTYLRFSGKNILKSNHSMFLTTILIGQPLFDSLTSEQQEAFTIASKRVAKIERKWSLEDCKKYENTAKERGCTIVDISEEDTKRLKQSAPVQYEATIDGDMRHIVEDIRSIG